MRVPLEVRLGDVYVTPRIKSLGYRSAIPGGFASASFSLDEPLSGSPPALASFNDVSVVDGRNGGIVWQGRLEDPAKGVGADGQVWQLKALGPSAHAKDNNGPLVYIDSSHQLWERFLNTMPGAVDEKTEDPAAPGSLRQAVVLRFPNGSDLVTDGWVEVLYRTLDDAMQAPARMDFTWAGGRNEANIKPGVIVRSAVTANDQPLYVVNSTTAGASASVVIGSGAWTRTDQTRIGVSMRWAGTPVKVADEATWVAFSRLILQAVRYDRSGNKLLTSASYPAAHVRSDQVVADLLGRPGYLPHYDADLAEIEAGAYNIDQLAFSGGTNPAGVFEELMRLEPDFYWAAWTKTPAGKYRFVWQRWPTGVRYEVSAADDFSSPASTAELYNVVNVRWRAANGNVRWVQRRGAVAELDAKGLTRALFVDLATSVGSEGAAVQRAEAELAAHASPANAGSLTISGPTYDAVAGRMVQPWEIRPGALVKVAGVEPRPDALNPSDGDATSVFRAISTDYDSDRNATTVALDSEPATIATLVAAGRRDGGLA